MFFFKQPAVNEQHRFECSALLRETGGMWRHGAGRQPSYIRVVAARSHEEYRTFAGSESLKEGLLVFILYELPIILHT